MYFGRCGWKEGGIWGVLFGGKFNVLRRYYFKGRFRGRCGGANAREGHDDGGGGFSLRLKAWGRGGKLGVCDWTTSVRFGRMWTRDLRFVPNVSCGGRGGSMATIRLYSTGDDGPTFRLWRKVRCGVGRYWGYWKVALNPFGGRPCWVCIVVFYNTFFLGFVSYWVSKKRQFFLTDEQILEFERSRSNAMEQVDYQRGLRGDGGEDVVFREEIVGSMTVFEKVTFFFRIYCRILELGYIFSFVVVSAPFLYPFAPLRRIWWGKLKRALNGAGGCWVKAAQWASTRPDLFSEELIGNMRDLQDECVMHSFEDTRKIIESDYGVRLEQVFDEFSREPIASGAIGQVYKAVLRVSGQEVAVKVLHPGIVRKIRVDLSIIAMFARAASLIPGYSFLNFRQSIAVFTSNMIAQLDMRTEARNLVRFRKNFEGNRGVVFPLVIDHMTTREILVETYEHGQTLSSLLRMGLSKEECRKLAHIGLRSFLTMLLVHNFIHADLHPGNLLVRKSPAADDLQLVILDVGLVCELKPTDWLHFKQLFKCIVQGNGREAAHLMIKYSPNAGDSQLSPEIQEMFMKETNDLFYGLRSNKLSRIHVGMFLYDLLKLVRKYRVTIESNFATLCVATIVLEGIGRQLDPDIMILDQSVPFLMWSEKASIYDRLVFLREKARDEFESNPDNETTPFHKKVYNILRPIMNAVIVLFVPDYTD